MPNSKALLYALVILLVSSGSTFAGFIRLTCAELHPKDYPTTLGLFKFAELVKVRTHGEILIDVKYAGQLGKDENKIIEQVQFGALDLARISIAPALEFVPALEVFSLPYIWDSKEHMWRVLNGKTGQRLLEAIEKFKFYGLAYYESGARSFYNSKRLINSVDDLKGLNIRVQQSKLMVDLVDAMGANAIPMPFGEIYDALNRREIDGAENNLPSYEYTNHYKVAKYLTLDYHTRVPELLLGSKIALNKKLTSIQIELIKLTAKETQEFVIKTWDEREKNAQKKVLLNGVKINILTPDQRKQFINAVQPLTAVYKKKHKAVIEEILSQQ
jgi:tripartite ATP-independent transporter DctP family solute receptor